MSPGPDFRYRSPRHRVIKLLNRWFLLTLGALFVGVGLEIFLVPNKIIDGGIVGIAIMASHLTGLPLAGLLFIFNAPFLWVGYLQIGRTFAVSTLYAVGALSVFVSFLETTPAITDDLLLAAVFGGVILGLGVGTIIRTGGSLDGSEIVAIVLSRRLPFSVGEIIMFFNLFILGSAGLVFGWDRAMYSLLAYFIAFKAIDVAVEGLEESKSAIIITDNPEPMKDAIIHRLGRGVTELVGKGGFSGAEKTVLYCVVTRLEIAKLKGIVMDHDPSAFVAIENVHEVLGGRLKKRPIH